MTIQPNERFASSGGDLGTPLQEKAEEIMHRAGDNARSRFDDEKERAARELGTVAHALRQCGTDLENDRAAMLAPYVSRVAAQVERFSTFINTHSAEELARDVEGFARRNPAVFLGSCFALGMVAARFLKASRPEQPTAHSYQQRPLDQVGYRTSTGYESSSTFNRQLGDQESFGASSGRARDR